MIPLDSAIIQLNYIEEGLTLTIDAKKPDSLFDFKNADEEGECRYQLKETLTCKVSIALNSLLVLTNGK